MVRRQMSRTRHKVEGNGRGILKILTCTFLSKDWGIPRKTSVNISDVLYEIRTEYLRNKNLGALPLELGCSTCYISALACIFIATKITPLADFIALLSFWQELTEEFRPCEFIINLSLHVTTPLSVSSGVIMFVARYGVFVKYIPS